LRHVPGWGEALALGPYINSGPIDAETIARRGC
jgi:hypothetical protein